jgi:hypothetical protein
MASAAPTATPSKAIATERRDAADGRRQHQQHGEGEQDLHGLPADRSHATARSPRPTSRVSRPWLIPRWTSPTTPPGSVTLRKSER